MIPPVPYLISDRVFPPLGILYVASILEQARRDVQVLDLTGDRRWRSTLVSALGDGRFRAVGLTATTPDYPQSLEILRLIREAAPDACVILGGPHATIDPARCLGFDKVVAGDGWTGIFQALDPHSPRLIEAPPVRDLDSVPYPARHLIDLSRYRYEIGGLRATSLITQLGCPYGCVFCCGRDLPFYRKVRARSVEHVIREMDHLNAAHGFRAFMFYDDEFNLNRPRTLALCALLKTRRYLWRAPVRADLLDPGLARAMAESGCVEVSVGVESGSRKLLKNAGKGTTPEINARARRLCREHGIRFKAFVIVGLPGSTYEDEMMTKKWLIDHGPDDFDIGVNAPYPGTPQYRHPERYGVRISADFESEVVTNKTIPGRYRSYLRTEHLSFDEIVRLRDEIDREARAALGLPPPGNSGAAKGKVGLTDSRTA